MVLPTAFSSERWSTDLAVACAQRRRTMEGKPEPEQEEARQRWRDELVPTKPSRGLMYLLISLHGMPNWMIRGGIFSWMPFVIRDLGLSEAQRALLMGAWFPGYAFAQVPAAALMVRIRAASSGRPRGPPGPRGRAIS